MKISHGNFDKLADNYDKYRPGYSKPVKNIILDYVNTDNINFADVGAGTGIWTRIVNQDKRVLSSIAVEPSYNMREFGKNHNANSDIIWIEGTAESTNLQDSSKNLVTMASSFHWANFEDATKEFHRILENDGVFCALWNPRYIFDNPILVDIENKITDLKPNIKRVSSGKSDFVENLTSKFNDNEYFNDLVFLESRHTKEMTREQYIGAWLSVNDIQFQLGAKFSPFIEYIKDKIKNENIIYASYITRAWLVRKKK